MFVLSEDHTRPWFHQSRSEIKNAFSAYYPDGELSFQFVNVHVDSLTNGQFKSLREYLNSLHTVDKFDLILYDSEIGYRALNGILEFAQSTPNLFINYSSNQDLVDLPKHHYSVDVQTNYLELMRQAIELTQTEQVLIVGKRSSGLGRLTDFDELLRDADAIGLQSSEFFEFSTLSELEAKLSELQSKSEAKQNISVLITPFFINQNGEYIEPALVAEYIGRFLDVPVFVHWETMLNEHIIGGHVLSPKLVARETVSAMANLINDQLPVVESRNMFRNIYNLALAEQHKIDLHALPANAKLYNQSVNETRVSIATLTLFALALFLVFVFVFALFFIKRLFLSQQQKLRRLESRVEQLLEQNKVVTSVSQMGVWEYDVASDALTWDALMFKLHDLSDSDFNHTLQEWFDAVADEDANDLRTNILYCLNKGHSIQQEYRILGKNGVRFLSLACEPTVNLSDKVVKLVGCVRDISMQVNQESQMHEDRNKVDLAIKSNTQFVSSISQELRTPINTIFNAANLVSKEQLDSEQLSYLGLINGAAYSLMQTVKDIFDLTKLNTGKLNIEKYGFDLQNMIQQTLANHQMSVRNKHLRLTLDMSNSLPKYVVSDALRIRQILFNLLSNAIKYTDIGTINVSVAFKRDDSNSKTGKLVFVVSDTGVGMSEEQCQNVFSRFEKVSLTQSASRESGPGLGLNISRKIAHKLGGDLKVESAKGRGSVFTLVVPTYVTQEYALQQNLYENPYVPNLAGKRVLIVDDIEINRLIMEQILSETRVESVYASNGKLALEVFQSQQIDFILMDILMPVMDGLEAIQAIRRGESLVNKCDIPIICFTAQGLEGDKELCLTAGGNAFLTKPVNRSDLFNSIKEVVLSVRS